MYQKSFVAPDSIVRKIWSQADMVLFIFAASAAEFSLNKDVDWLYFTGKLPKDPLGRMFSTVAYARAIIWMDEAQAIHTISKMKQIHHDVEQARKQQIPQTAFRDVLYMLIAASIKAKEVLEEPLTEQEKEDIFDVFIRMGRQMGITNLPKTYTDWTIDRTEHLAIHLRKTQFTIDLYRQFRLNLGFWRYLLLRNIQDEMCDDVVLKQLQQKQSYFSNILINIYKVIRKRYWIRKNIPLLIPLAFCHNMKELNTLPR